MAVAEFADVAVIGAGLAGLTAARELTRQGFNTVVIEARNRVGGRLWNGELPGGAAIDLGGQWVGPGQFRVMGLIRELGLSTFPTYDVGLRVMESGGRRRTYSGRMPRVGPMVAADILRARLRVDRAAARIPLAAPWDAEDAEALDGQTFARWLAPRFGTKRGRALSRLVTEVFAAEPDEVSALWALFYIGAAGGVDALMDIADGAQQDRVVGGAQGIATAIAAQLGGRLRLGAPARSVVWDADGVTVHGNGFEVRSTRAVIAVPPSLAAKLAYYPHLSHARRALAARMPMGRVIKVNVIYDEPFWRRDGLSGMANSDCRAVGTVYDNSPPANTGGPGVLVGFLEGRWADVTSGMPQQRRGAMVLDDLVAYFGPRAARPLDIMEINWAAEQFTEGCYGPFAIPETLVPYGPALRAPVGPLHWAGAETAVRWAGHMDGAVDSGHRVASEIAQALAERPVTVG